ncbi:fused MFS/spermidine synthase [Pseudokineococcus marinus]|uniref:Fused MFS/spermidine synthase n=1 Tax=Pseudokineococcus marinus TaxID=351215 RepID=A0A849BMB1_9ACTN|nr:fused MFS/spermidine synthase [Pseudokineococcus marinus]NNH24340.1 fused MFS/spermidine synthase [Pseudokineococcus marinus]
MPDRHRPSRASADRGSRPQPQPGTWSTASGVVELARSGSDEQAWTVFVNGVASSSVHTGDPTVLEFEYLRWMADVLDEREPAGGPLEVVHLGAAGCALARYVDATRPGSRQVAVEVDEDLARLVREWFDLPRSPALRLQVGDARERLATRRDASADAVVRDVFAGDTTPRHVRTLEFTRDVARVLRPDGTYLANVADRPPLKKLRREVATVAEVFEHVGVLAETGLLRGRRYANAVVVASPSPLPADRLVRRAARAPVPTRWVDGEDLVELVAGARSEQDPAPPVEPVNGQEAVEEASG